MEVNFSDVSVCNSALLKVGAPPISSFLDGTKPADICAAQYPILRDEVLRNTAWKFALERINLATPVSQPPTFGYMYAYTIPSNVLRVWRVYPCDDWTVQAGQILCDKPDGIDVVAIIQSTDPTTWDPQFAECLAWRLASELALALVQSPQLKQDMDKGYKESLGVARSTNSMEGIAETLQPNTWVNSRRYGPKRRFFGYDW